MLYTLNHSRVRLNISVKQFAVKAPLTLLALAVLTGYGCGKRSAPVAPKERVFQRVEVFGFQRGNQVVLSWKMPARNAPKGNLLNISRADIYRLAERANSPLQLSEEEFSNRSTLIAALAITDGDFGLKTLTYKDTLEFAGQAARLRYAIRFVNATGQKAGFSNSLLIEPTSKVAAAPSSLSAEPTQDAVKLKWQQTVDSYIGNRESLKGLVLIMDIRHPMRELDVKLLEYCDDRGLSVHIVLNKIDKISKSAAMSTMKEVQGIVKECHNKVTVQLFSALKGVGLKELHALLDQWYGY